MNDPRAKRARPTSPVEALLFDLDGTLVDSEPFHRQTLRNWFAARGWPADEDLLAGFARTASRRCARHAIRALGR